jgi:aminocarboxymuconate-semialdehyde decarboxylase
MIVDVHGHISPPQIAERFPIPAALLDIDAMIERKAQAGIGLTVVGSPVGVGTMTKVPGFDHYEQPADELRRFHDWLAQTVTDHPGRLKAYAYTNPFGGDALLEQTAETVRDGGFVGLIVNSSVRGEYLDSKRADPFFAMASELDVPVFLHAPPEPVGADNLRDWGLVEQVGRFTDVTLGLATLLYSGVLERHPTVKVIAPMGGGAISLLLTRLDTARRPFGAPPPAGSGGERAQQVDVPGPPPTAALDRVYVDTATPEFHHLVANLEALGAERMLFGTDSPPSPWPVGDAVELVRRLPIGEPERQRIFSENARKLLKLEPSTA